MAVVALLGIRKDVEEAVLAAFSGKDDVVRLPGFVLQDVPAEVQLIVAAGTSMAATAIAIRRVTALPLILVGDVPPEERAAALESGADACLLPSDVQGMLPAQVHALLRRTGRAPELLVEERVIAGNLVMDRSARRVLCGESEIQFAPREFDLLDYLIQNLSRALRRHELLASVWGPRYVGDTNTVDVHIAWLRQKLPADAGVRITTLRGVGYRLDELTGR